MRCEECHGIGSSERPYPCKACGGTGFTLCCEGAVGGSDEVCNKENIECTVYHGTSSPTS